MVGLQTNNAVENVCGSGCPTTNNPQYQLANNLKPLGFGKDCHGKLGGSHKEGIITKLIINACLKNNGLFCCTSMEVSFRMC